MDSICERIGLSAADIFKVMDVTQRRQVETLKGCDRRARCLPKARW
jgi:hypothetical protein